MKPLLRSGADKYKLLQLVALKENAGLFVWYLLAGFLASIVSYHYAISAECDVSADELERRHQEYEKVLASRDADSKKPVRIYTSRE